MAMIYLERITMFWQFDLLGKQTWERVTVANK